MLNFVRFWILLSTLLVAGGWILSALHQLNRAGYVLLLSPLVLFILFRWRRDRVLSRANFHRWRAKFSKRFRRRAPQIFLLIAVFSSVGGCLYPPLNYDANAYRLPRVMHWLWAGQWHWIHTFDDRMNIAACGMEWLSAPLILFTRSDRLLFLVNFISYLMLPGLIFSVFTRLKVRPRVAWWWSWLLSAGLCYALQAGSAANDSFAAIYILAAVDLALRARQTNSITDLWLSLLAAALLTGTKQSALPLVALWFIAAWPARSLLGQHAWRSTAVAGLGLLVSIVPAGILNYHHYGTWMPLEITGMAAIGKFQLNPFWGIVGNAFCIPVQNLVPPFYAVLPPLHSYWPVLWNEWMNRFAQTSLGAHFASFERFGFLSEAYYHGVSEANAGLGLGICLMIFVTLRELKRLKKPLRSGPIPVGGSPPPTIFLLRLAPWGLLLVFMAKVGAFENARHLAPYYPFLFPAWLAGAGQSQVTRRQSWQRFGLVTMAVAALLVAASAERPLFPAQTVFKWVQQRFSSSDFLSEECVHYLESTSQIALGRREFFKNKLPSDEKVVGYYDRLSAADEPGIWLPYGQRRVECLLPDEPPERLRDLGIHYVVINGSTLKNTYGDISKWLDRYNASVVAQYAFPASTRQTSAPADLYLVRLN